MGLFFTTIRVVSAEVSAGFLFGKMVGYVLEAQRKIEGIEGYGVTSKAAEGDLTLELLCFSFFLTSAVLNSVRFIRRNAHETLGFFFEKIITDITQHKNPRLKYHVFHDYFDEVFTEHCRDYEKYGFDIRQRRNIVGLAADRLARICGRSQGSELIPVVNGLYGDIVGTVA